MANDSFFRLLFSLCRDTNKMVFEVCPLFGDKLTLEEMHYWICFNIIEKAKFFDVDYEALPMGEVQKLITKEERKRDVKLKKISGKKGTPEPTGFKTANKGV